MICLHMFAASTRTYAYVPYICTCRYIPGHVCMNVLSCGVMWRVCIYMCVWTICIDVKLLLVVLVFPVSTLGLQGAQAHCGYLCQRSYSTMGEAEIDHLRVPAPIFIFVNGDRLSQVPACRWVFPISIMDYAASEPSSELRCQQASIHCTVFAI